MAFIPTGDAEIDRIRQEAAQTPTNKDSYEDRYLLLITWRHLLQRQGAATAVAGPVLDRYREAHLERDEEKLFATIDEEFRVLGRIQHDLTESPPESMPSGEEAPEGAAAPIDWPMYGAGPQHTAATEEPLQVLGAFLGRHPTRHLTHRSQEGKLSGR